MRIFWNNRGPHMLNLGKGGSWHLYSTMEDEHAYIILEHDGQRYELARDHEMLQREQFQTLNGEDMRHLFELVVIDVTAKIRCGAYDINIVASFAEWEQVCWKRWYTEGKTIVPPPEFD